MNNAAQRIVKRMILYAFASALVSLVFHFCHCFPLKFPCGMLCPSSFLHWQVVTFCQRRKLSNPIPSFLSTLCFAFHFWLHFWVLFETFWTFSQAFYPSDPSGFSMFFFMPRFPGLWSSCSIEKSAARLAGQACHDCGSVRLATLPLAQGHQPGRQALARIAREVTQKYRAKRSRSIMITPHPHYVADKTLNSSVPIHLGTLLAARYQKTCCASCTKSFVNARMAEKLCTLN